MLDAHTNDLTCTLQACASIFTPFDLPPNPDRPLAPLFPPFPSHNTHRHAHVDTDTHIHMHTCTHTFTRIHAHTHKHMHLVQHTGAVRLAQSRQASLVPGTAQAGPAGRAVPVHMLLLLLLLLPALPAAPLHSFAHLQ